MSATLVFECGCLISKSMSLGKSEIEQVLVCPVHALKCKKEIKQLADAREILARAISKLLIKKTKNNATTIKRRKP